AAGTALEITITDGAGGSETISVGTTVEAGSADLVEANEFMKKANDKLAAATVNARVDIVNGSIAFTSTILGQLNNDGAAATKGTINVTSTGNGLLNNALGYKDGTAKGAGDTNFQIHVVNNNSQFQIGANAGQRMEISIGDMSAKALGIDKLDMSTTEGAQSAIEKLDQALARVSAERSKLGAYSNRLNYTMNNLENTATNLTDAESRVRDADMAAEMINFTSAQIMQQAGTAMLAQANAMGQSVLSLLG
ncbi:MAG: flagellin, partial [Candidatus Riflebacteria bacterium]|nr:flagellin [Candidatus Riflebacteria bacterium]